MSFYVHAIAWLVLLAVVAVVWGLLRVAGEGSREDEAETKRRALAAANRDFQTKGER